MKGLLLKDLYQIWEYYKMYYVLAILMEIVSIWVGNPFLAIYPVMLFGFIPNNLMIVDENSKWVQYCGGLPCTRKQVVTEKYLLGLLTALPALALACLCQILRMDLRGQFSWQGLGDILFICLASITLLPALSLPLNFRFGNAKATAVRLVVVGAFCGGVAGLGFAAGNTGMRMPMAGGELLALLGLGAVYLLSWYLSVKFYEKRDLG